MPDNHRPLVSSFWRGSDVAERLFSLRDHVRLTNGDDEYEVANRGEYVSALGGDDRVVGGRSADVIRGGSGNDGLLGEQGADRLIGGGGDDSLFGHRGNDELIGGDGNDNINPGGGADLIVGGLGRDQVTVNQSPDGASTDGQRDTLVYERVEDSLPNAEDQVAFFRVDEDKIDLSLIDADAGTSENDVFDFIGDRVFSGTAGELRIDSGSGNIYIQADVNGDGVADLSIRIIFSAMDPDTLHARDFVL